jgi:HlyD family type I secretion membrane fusion protein
VNAWYAELFGPGGPLDDWQIGRAEAGTLLLVVLAGLLVLLWFAVRRHGGGGEAASLARLTRRPRALGYAALVVLCGGFGTWAWIAPLASAAIAPGVVSPDGSRKTVQHFEGGIIRGIHVREGDPVVAGQPLVTLEDTQARALYEELRERYVHLLAAESRLVAEQTGAGEVQLPANLTTLGSREARRAIEGQADLLRSRRATLLGREQILGQRVKQLDEENVGLAEMIAAQDLQLALIEQEIGGVQELYDKGLERLPRLLELQRAQAAIRAEQAGNRAQIARNGQEIGETEMQLLTMRQEDKERVNEELTTVRTALAELRTQLPSREDVLSRTLILAPLSGIAMNLQITTESGVLTPGQPILDIVPAEAKLIIDARVKPIDIDTVEQGMQARIMLPAYRQRNLPQIHGTVRSISADRLIEDRSGEAYFLAKVEVDAAELARLDDVRLSPGMPAEVMVLTGEYTLLDYLLRPLLDSVTKSFREN